MRVRVVEWDTHIVVLPERPVLILRLQDVVFGRTTAVVAIRQQKDELSLVGRLKVWAVNEHDGRGNEEKKLYLMLYIMYELHISRDCYTHDIVHDPDSASRLARR